jgi:hypothetical protein
MKISRVSTSRKRKVRITITKTRFVDADYAIQKESDNTERTELSSDSVLDAGDSDSRRNRPYPVGSVIPDTLNNE